VAAKVIRSRTRWRPRHLLLAWGGYWIALVLVKLWPAIAAGWRMSQHAGEQKNVSVNLSNTIFSASVSEAGKAMWTGSISVLTLSLLVAGPPFLLWLAWLAASSRTNNADESALTSQKRQSELYPAESKTAIVDTSTSKRRTREES
jgi:hypothetical protein